jgi:thiol-disulfide isomerase/thioredoxin
MEIKLPMKFTTLILLFVTGLPSLRADALPPAQTTPDDKTQLTETSADADFAALKALGDSFTPKEPKFIGRPKFLAIFDQRARALRSATLAFYLAHPTDPRRWDSVMEVLQYREFIKGSKPETFAAVVNNLTDEPTKEIWAKQYAAWIQEMLDSTDVTMETKEGLEWDRFAADFRATTAAKSKGEPYDYSGFRARFDAHAAKYGGMERVAERAADYLGALEASVPGASLEIWQHLLEASNAALRNKAAERVKFFERLSRPLEMTFTAVDGRRVDLKTLHGKVVLIDFWATWCGPCKEEIPNVKKVYAAYHAKGFEVVGIALEDGKLMPKDTPEQTAAKLAKAKKVLTDFTTANAMPWSQYFDGKFWKNDISTQYNIQSIPAMFLLDQEGKVVSTNARGEALEREVKRLLKL